MPQGDLSDDLFRARLSNQLDRKHPLVRLAELIEWASFESEFGSLYHETLGRPGKPTRLMVGLTYLKHCYNLSDEQVCEAGWRTRIGSSSAHSITCSTGCRLIRVH